MKLPKMSKVKKPSALAALCILTALALLFSGGVVTMARFLFQDEGEGLAVAKPFYFTSDKLTAEAPYYQLDPDPDGSGTITVQVRNYADQYRVTGFTYRFAWKVTDEEGNVLKDPVNLELTGGAASTQSLSYTAAAGYLSGGRSVVVTAYPIITEGAAAQPYTEVISARFGFDVEGNVRFRLLSEEEDGVTLDNAVVLEITGGNGGNVTVTWPETGLTPDKTNSALAGATGNSATFTAERGVHYALVFLKTDPSASFTEESFSVVPAASTS